MRVLGAAARDGGVEQGGGRLLTEEFHTAPRCWRARGEPGLDRFGLTVDRGAGSQTVWVDGPQHALWTAHR